MTLPLNSPTFKFKFQLLKFSRRRKIAGTDPDMSHYFPFHVSVSYFPLSVSVPLFTYPLHHPFSVWSVLSFSSQYSCPFFSMHLCLSLQCICAFPHSVSVPFFTVCMYLHFIIFFFLEHWVWFYKISNAFPLSVSIPLFSSQCVYSFYFPLSVCIPFFSS